MGLMFFMVGCGTTSGGPNPFDGTPAGSNSTEDPIRIDVQNLSFNDVSVWAIRQGQRVRLLGRVTGKTDATFTINWNVALPISFSIDVVGGRSCTTVQVGVDRDARVWISIPSNVGAQPCQAGRR
ncbi:MAG: hypothetical protein O2956_03500 [Gemmatimonadetes bacterium]|nr:hypothetical protein [Gemmatimonadota bacterium]